MDATILHTLKNLAHNLLNTTILYINNVPHRICEIEAYYRDQFYFPDPFTHNDELQKTSGQWYFHRQNGGKYKGGTFKGLDLTCGNNQDYGGFLIRSIMNITDSNLIEGPCLVVDYILQQGQCPNIADFVQKYGIDGQNNQALYYISDQNLNIERIYRGPRVGLTLKNPSSDKLRYIMAPLRFLIFPHRIKKYIATIVIELYKRGEKNIAAITGLRQSLIDKYVQIYKNALDQRRVDYIDTFYNKTWTLNDVISVQSILAK